MTLLNIDDDQMVPQGSLAGIQQQQQFQQLESAAESPLYTAIADINDGLNTPTLLKPIPDFESLLTGLTDDYCPSSWTDPDPADLMYPMATDPAADAYRSLGGSSGGDSVHDPDLTFYDDHPLTSVTIKQEKPYLAEDYGQQQQVEGQQQQQQQQHQMVVGTIQMVSTTEVPSVMRKSSSSLPDEGTPQDLEAAAVTKEIDGVCNLLNIPVSPYQWTVEQVTKWATWTLEQYNLPARYLYDLCIDGTTLCLLPAEEFKSRWPHFGEYLFAQLEVWKGAYEHIKAESSPTDIYDEPPTYMELEPFNHHTQQQQHQQQQQQQPQTTPHTHHQHPHHPQNPTSPHHQHQQALSPHQHQHQQLHHHHQQQQHHQQHHPQHHHQPQPAYIPMTQSVTTSPSPSPCQSLYGSDMMLTSMAAIPKPVLTGNLGCGSNLSPASSLDSMDSFASSPASEADFDRSFGATSMQPEPRPEVTPSKQNIHLWQFLRELLIQQHNYGSAIRWLDRSKGIFKIEDSARVARLWGQRKNRPAMNYDKLSRSIRQYYKKGIIKKTDNSKRLVYQFCPQYRV